MIESNEGLMHVTMVTGVSNDGPTGTLERQREGRGAGVTVPPPPHPHRGATRHTTRLRR